MTPPGVTRWALLLEYDGGAFSGWQRQRGEPTLQAALEEAAAHLAAGHPPPAAAAAGRTDAGVHAAAQVAMIELPGRYGAATIRDALNFHLRPHAFVVLQAALAPPGWHPRFSAIGRAYEYRILNRRTRPALRRGHAWHVQPPLDEHAMAEAAALLRGRHDFTSFRATACQAKSPVRTLERLDVVRHGDMLLVHAEARSFLHHQVRNIVGTLKLVGEGRWPASRVAHVLAARARAAAGPTAPPEGLTLTAVRYGTDPFSPACGPPPAGP